MKDKYRSRYRIKSSRAPWWNYALAGSYFITICTRKRKHYFGKIINGEMQLSPMGEWAHKLWNEIPDHFPNVELGAFQVMPDHIHGIIDLVYTRKPDIDRDPNNDRIPTAVETLHATSLPMLPNGIPPSPTGKPASPIIGIPVPPLQFPKPPIRLPLSPIRIPSVNKNKRMAAISPKSQTISVILRSYKSAVSNEIHKTGVDFGWQPRFHDRIIRNDLEYINVHYYIKNNPRKWGRANSR